MPKRKKMNLKQKKSDNNPKNQDQTKIERYNSLLEYQKVKVIMKTERKILKKNFIYYKKN